MHTVYVQILHFKTKENTKKKEMLYLPVRCMFVKVQKAFQLLETWLSGCIKKFAVTNVGVSHDWNWKAKKACRF